MRRAKGGKGEIPYELLSLVLPALTGGWHHQSQLPFRCPQDPEPCKVPSGL